MNKYNSSNFTLMLSEIAKTHPLSLEEEKQLFLEYNNSSSEKRKKDIKLKIISSNMRFVLQVALCYKTIQGVNISDLVGEGKIGLLIAFDKHDPSKNTKFISYAVWWIRSRMKAYLEDNSLIHIPNYQKVNLNNERKTKDMKDFSSDTYYLHEIISTPLDLNYKLPGKNLNYSETIKDERIEDFSKIHMLKKVKEKLIKYLSNVLSKDEFIIITNLYGINSGNAISLRNIADIVDKSHERIRQIRDNALKTLKKSNGMKEFKELFLEAKEG